MHDHINCIFQGTYLQLRKLKYQLHIHKSFLECVVRAFITSKLDYCNSVLVGLPSCHIERLQRTQNAAARILTSTPKYEHITPVLRQLHWLPVEKRIIFKTLLMVFKAFHGLAPHYIQELISHYTPSRSLRSSNDKRLNVPHTSSTLVQSRAFSFVGPKLWNDLPRHIRFVHSIEQFKSKL